MRPYPAVAIAAAAVAVLAGCAPGESESKDDKDGQYSAGDVTLDSKPERIVSLSAAATEMLFAIDAGDQVEAADMTSNYPKDAPTTDLDAFNPNPEAIADYEPDLVVVSHDQEGIVKKLKEIELPVYYAPAAESLDDTYSQLTDLGALTGHTKQAKQLADDMDADIATMTEDLPEGDESHSVYYELDDEYFSLTSDTYAGSLLDEAGLENIADEADDAAETGGYPQLSAEFVVDADPDLIFVAGGQSASDLSERDGWDAISAVKNDNVVELDPDLASRWGPRTVDLMKSITDAVSAV